MENHPLAGFLPDDILGFTIPAQALGPLGSIAYRSSIKEYRGYKIQVNSRGLWIVWFSDMTGVDICQIASQIPDIGSVCEFVILHHHHLSELQFLRKLTESEFQRKCLANNLQAQPLEYALGITSR